MKNKPKIFAALIVIVVFIVSACSSNSTGNAAAVDKVARYKQLLENPQASDDHSFVPADDSDNTEDTTQTNQINSIVVKTPSKHYNAPVGNKKGNHAPYFEVTTIDNEKFSLNDQIEASKPTLVYFWATWCPFCAKDFEVVKRVYPKYKDSVDFIAIDLDMSETNDVIKQYRDDKNIQFVKFAPAQSKILQDYAIRSTTTKFAVAKDGKIIWTGSGAVDDNTWETIFKGLVAS